ncbi:MAG: cation diffusion facilitator family transporter [Solirubrobacteraceae bacterium]
MTPPGHPPALARLMWLSIAAAVTTIALKTIAWRLTGSVGLLSDAMESVVNLVAAVVGLALLRWALTPPDRRHTYGHEKAEYFSAGVEGALILVAAGAIVFAAIHRLLNQVALEEVGIGTAVSALASAVNLAVGVLLLREGRRQRSITVEADGRHLLTDVWTSAGVIAAVIAVALTHWWWLDPVIAIAVALNILATGVSLLRRAGRGLMDAALPAADQEKLELALAPYRGEGVEFHAIRTRQAGRRSFVSLHVLVPGDWTVQHGHDLVERLERNIHSELPEAAVTTHVEPVGDPASHRDVALDRSWD